MAIGPQRKGNGLKRMINVQEATWSRTWVVTTEQTDDTVVCWAVVDPSGRRYTGSVTSECDVMAAARAALTAHYGRAI